MVLLAKAIMKHIKLSLILPCYNEAQHLVTSLNSIITTLQSIHIPYELILVDDASRDQTQELINKYTAKYRKLPLLKMFHDYNIGRGGSVVDGIKKARGIYAGFIDIDCEISPKYISQFIESLESSSDVVCAQRQYQISFFGLIRALASKTYMIISHLMLGIDSGDSEAGYKFFKKEKILPILKTVKDSGWFWDTEIMVRSKMAGLKIRFIPVEFHRRSDKTSTVHLYSDTINYLGNLINFRNEIALLKNMKTKTQLNLIDSYWQKKSPAFSNQYTTIFGFPITPVGIFLQVRHQKINAILQNLPGNVLLDVGCGSGIFMRDAIELGKFAIGVDYSKQMLAIAAKNLSVHSNTQFKLLFGTATKLPLKSHSVDILLASGLTDYLTKEEVQSFFAQIKRILKKGGYVVITFPRQESPFSFLRAGFGLILRQKLLHLPPMETAYSKNDIEKLCISGGIKPKHWESVLSTMWVMTGQKYE